MHKKAFDSKKLCVYSVSTASNGRNNDRTTGPYCLQNCFGKKSMHCSQTDMPLDSTSICSKCFFFSKFSHDATASSETNEQYYCMIGIITDTDPTERIRFAHYLDKTF